MGFYGKWETWKIVYLPKMKVMDGTRGVAFVEAGDKPHALATFSQQYAGKYVTVERCEKLFGNN